MRKINLFEKRSQPRLSQIQNQREKKKGKKGRGIAKSLDIKSMFKNAASNHKAPKENEDDSDVILDQSSLFQMLFQFKQKSMKNAENNITFVFFLFCVFIIELAKQCDLLYTGV